MLKVNQCLETPQRGYSMSLLCDMVLELCGDECALAGTCGRLLVLEFSQIPEPALQKAYDAYSFNVIPRMGRAVTGDRDSYQYLVESIRKFPDQETFAGMIRDAGFSRASYRNLTLGVAAIHSGWRL